MRGLVVAEFIALGAAIAFDGLGSVVATLPGAGTGPRIMVTAHMDEVGLMVQYVTADGFIRVKTLGGILDQALPDQRWTILGARARSRDQRPADHARPPDSAARRRVVADDIFLDVGAASREEVERMGIRPGDGVAPWSPFLVLPNGRYAAKAWDDRVGLGSDDRRGTPHSGGEPSASRSDPLGGDDAGGDRSARSANLRGPGATRSRHLRRGGRRG